MWLHNQVSSCLKSSVFFSLALYPAFCNLLSTSHTSCSCSSIVPSVTQMMSSSQTGVLNFCVFFQLDVNCQVFDCVIVFE